MNKDRLEKLIAIFKSQGLSKDEKEQMLKSIKYAVVEQSLKEESSQKMPFFSRFFSLQIFVNRQAIAAFCLIVLVFSTAGISKAAEQALPGDFLYPVKTQVNEKIKASLANTPAKKVKVESDLTIKRLKEAEALSEQGKLDEQKKEAITKSLTEHSEKAERNISEVRDHMGDDAALELDDELGFSLVEHVDVLDKLLEEHEDRIETKSLEDVKDSEDSEQKLEQSKRDFKPKYSRKVIKELQERAERSSHRNVDREEEPE